jgi:hypothetical protein
MPLICCFAASLACSALNPGFAAVHSAFNPRLGADRRLCLSRSPSHCMQRTAHTLPSPSAHTFHTQHWHRQHDRAPRHSNSEADPALLLPPGFPFLLLPQLLLLLLTRCFSTAPLLLLFLSSPLVWSFYGRNKNQRWRAQLVSYLCQLERRAEQADDLHQVQCRGVQTKVC